MLDIHIQRRQGDFFIDTAFQSPKGGVTALFGRSGAGKTSVISMVAGLVRPDEGHIVIDGRLLFDSRKSVNLPPEKRRIGYIFQEGRLFPHLSVRANLTYGMELTPRSLRYVTLDEVIDLLGIAHVIDRRPAKLSGGEKQRVAIGRALLTSPSLLLMDEPLASLDDARKQEVLPFIARLSHRFAIPILYVSHSLDEILALADTMVVLDAGRVAAAGAIEDTVHRRDLQHLIGYADGGAMIPTSVDSHDDTAGLTSLRFRGGLIKVPRLQCPLGGTIRVHIKARNVAITLVPPKQISVQNILPGTVEEIFYGDGPLVDVRLDIGCPLLARITVAALKDLDLRLGQQIYALIKSVAVSHSGI
jgi:molybdate transport system ATP-binding protein